ncbi:hypothetical protein GLP30_04925 [Photobacterium phosphoreum]|uniref:Uncharacterized protein n=1 Tax=Photobacterium phosphoreum TaxID=659 RepID=A0AAW4ZTL8_PHOPO|nr:hypothetical protein [Photobacterium phosphoreum]MCD9490171.1 hypothetical protein [Photobacterium phosphoreum]MCF2189437.1 hypothetical protein [Photobacterium phosphoreum]MCF2301225.1 hypothetical protein [Photobacterium phosphoreum]
MNNNFSFLANIDIPEGVVTAIPSSQTFPEFVEGRFSRYSEFVELFQSLVMNSSSSAELLNTIRDPKAYKAEVRMSLLKLFRRCVSTVIDTEKSKKLKIPTSLFVENYGHTFKDINLLQRQFSNMPDKEKYALTSLIGEYDDRGKQGYILTDLFFTWFEDKFANKFTIEGPRGAGKDIQLKSIFNDFDSDYPCDFIIRDYISNEVVAVGFARYDSTRGGSQSDDRTGGNNDKVMKADSFTQTSNKNFKLLFLSDGPGLTHKDTWEEACILDGKLNDRVRVSTLKLAETRISEEWLKS